MKLGKQAAYFGMVCMLAMTGCGNNHAEVSDGTDKADNIGETADKADAMGRYVEEAVDLSAQLSYGDRLFQLEDGRLVIADMENDFVASKDSGVTWEADKRDWKTDMMARQTYILDYAVGADNTVGVIYEKESGIIPNDTNEEEMADVSENAGEGTDGEAEVNGDTPDNPFDVDWELMIIRPDGSRSVVEFSLGEADDSVYHVWISDTGRVFATTYGPSVYEIKEDGSSEIFLTLDAGYEMPNLIQFSGNLMILDGELYDGLLIYDMEKEEYVEDEVLNEFVNTNYHGRTGNGGSFYDLYFFTGEENVLYLAGEKGLHRHVIGGSAMEQVIDGNLSAFSNPAYALCGMTVLDNSEFLALFTGGRLVRFIYDPDIPTVPSEKLKVYSLQDNRTIRQAINLYQREHPEYYVEYEIGMEEGTSVTRDDVLKILNTKIMAGEGPDILILDNLPIDAYLEKGMLLELTPFLSSLSEEEALFENIVDAFRVDDKVYMLPCEIQLPMLFGKEDYISGVTQLSDIADAVEALRQDNPEKDLIGVCSEKGIMRLFSMISSPYWKDDNDEIDKEALTEYYEQTKRIYDAQMDALSEDAIREYTEWNDYFLELYGYGMEDSSLLVREGIDYISYAVGIRQLECGTLVSSYEYAALSSIQQLEEYEGSQITQMDEDIFYPQTLAGISSASHNTEAAGNFLRLLLGKENQSSLYNGFSVNKAVFDDDVHGGQYQILDDGVLSHLSVGTGDGNIITISIYWPTEEQIRVLQSIMESVNTACIEDSVLENAVYEEGIAYFQGDKSVEEAVEGVTEEVSLYMAE